MNKNLKVDADILISEFIEFATIEGETKLSGDYKLGNKMVKKMNKICDKVKLDDDLARHVFTAVMKSGSARARSLSAVSALRLNILVEEAIAVLEEESKRKDILGFGPEMALKIYRGEVPGKTL